MMPGVPGERAPTPIVLGVEVGSMTVLVPPGAFKILSAVACSMEPYYRLFKDWLQAIEIIAVKWYNIQKNIMSLGKFEYSDGINPHLVAALEAIDGPNPNTSFYRQRQPADEQALIREQAEIDQPDDLDRYDTEAFAVIAAERNERIEQDLRAAEIMDQHPEVFNDLAGFNVKTPEQRYAVLNSICRILGTYDITHIPIEHLCADDRSALRRYADLSHCKASRNNAPDRRYAKLDFWDGRRYTNEPNLLEPRLSVESIERRKRKEAEGTTDLSHDNTLKAPNAELMAQARAQLELNKMADAIRGIGVEPLAQQESRLQPILELLENINAEHVVARVTYLNEPPGLTPKDREFFAKLTDRPQVGQPLEITVHSIKTGLQSLKQESAN